MQIDNDKKREMLLKNFDIIKDNYDKNHLSLAAAVVKMLTIDLDTAVDMWFYLVTKHASKVKSDDSWDLTGRIIYEGGKVIGEEKMGEIVLNNQVLKKAIFSQACDGIHLFVSDIIRRKISANELQVADELLSLVYKNKYKNSSWYEVMKVIIPENDDVWEITGEAFELIEMWCDKVNDQEERASLSIKLMEFID